MSEDLTGTSLAAIGRRITAVRVAKGMNQAAFARLCGLSAPQLNNYEQGFRRPNIDEAGKIASATGAGLDWIYRGERDKLPDDLAVKIFSRAS